MAAPYTEGTRVHTTVSPRGLVVAILPQFQHQTTPRPPAKLCEWWAMRRPAPMNPENTCGAKDLRTIRMFLTRVLSVSRMFGNGARGGRVMVAVDEVADRSTLNQR